MAFWAILVANFANNWGFHLLLTELPQYLSEIFPDYMDTGSKKGLWTAIPYGTMWIGEGQGGQGELEGGKTLSITGYRTLIQFSSCCPANTVKYRNVDWIFYYV